MSRESLLKFGILGDGPHEDDLLVRSQDSAISRSFESVYHNVIGKNIYQQYSVNNKMPAERRFKNYYNDSSYIIRDPRNIH